MTLVRASNFLRLALISKGSSALGPKTDGNSLGTRRPRTRLASVIASYIAIPYISIGPEEGEGLTYLAALPVTSWARMSANTLRTGQEQVIFVEKPRSSSRCHCFDAQLRYRDPLSRRDRLVDGFQLPIVSADIG